MRLDRLVAGAIDAGVTGDAASVEVTDITHDSRLVGPGTLFACVPGARADGHDFAPVAQQAGAVALLVQRPVPVDLPQVLVSSVRAAMGPLAARLNGDPSRQMTVVGVTGTNGKTTTTALLKAVFDEAGRPAAVIGTMTGERTTPEAAELQSLLAGFVRAGKKAVAMEVSSPALVQHRVAGTWFEAAVFTNLGRDHLDVHGTVEAYFEAKASFFRPELAGVGVVNADDEHGAVLLARRPIPMEPFSLRDAADLALGPQGSTFRWSGHPVRLQMGGQFNVANALAAATAARAVGVDVEVVAEALSAAPVVAGHFERIDAGQAFTVFVDYAHTPEALDAVLLSARQSAAERGRLIVVFGCGGDRDPGKRPQMGAAVASGADVAVLTSDNPRSEDPESILDDVVAGMTGPARVVREVDREAAIAVALAEARAGDVVVVAGKGHETGQEIGGRVLPFDDREVVRRILEAST